MFSCQHWQIKLVYAGFGCLFTIIGMLLSPVTAQKAMETIQCSRLEVVDAEGTVRVTITTDEQGGVVTAHGKNGHSEASLRVEEDWRARRCRRQRWPNEGVSLYRWSYRAYRDGR